MTKVLSITRDPYGHKTKVRGTAALRKAKCKRGHDTRDPNSRTGGTCKECKAMSHRLYAESHRKELNQKKRRLKVTKVLPVWVKDPGTQPLYLYPMWALYAMMYQRKITQADVATQLKISRERVHQMILSAVQGDTGHMDRLEDAVSQITLDRGGVYVSLCPDDPKMAEVKRAAAERYVNA